MKEWQENTNQVLNKAQHLKDMREHSELKSGHLLAALLEEGEVVSLLQNLENTDKERLAQVHQLLDSYPRLVNELSDHISDDVRKVLRGASVLCEKLNKEKVSPSVLFLSLSNYTGEKAVQELLSRWKINEKLIMNQLNSQKAASQSPEEQVLEKYGYFLTDESTQKKLDPVIGREEEIRRIIQILSRKTKNNPVLVGEPGTGKTAVVEGLAQRILNKDVPSSLSESRLYVLDLAALMAGAKYRGEFEARLKQLLEVLSGEEDIVLFIDEMHTIVGAGKTEGSMDLGNMLKPLLARGELRCIGATTLDEYRQYIEKDAALERRFQKVHISEPDLESSLSILRGIKSRFEMHHGVKISDSALVAAVELSSRYIADRFLPDKAIDLMDEAAAMVQTQLDTLPEELDLLNRKILLLDVEREALSRDKKAKERLGVINSELKKLRTRSSKMNEFWNEYRNFQKESQLLKEELEKSRFEMEKAQSGYDLEKAARLKYEEIPSLEQKIAQRSSESFLQKAAAEEDDEILSAFAENLKLMEEVQEESIARVLSRWTGIPVQKLEKSDREKILNAGQELRRWVKGQDEAVESVSEAILRNASGLRDSRKPIGSFLFLGPTGVGKTELAKALARNLFDSEKNMIRLDMSEFMEKHSISKLIGAPPGYVGFEEGGQLTERVRQKPYSVILFDEVEKAHPDVFNTLLQILDEGHIKDSKGRLVNFKNTIIILTSNLGSQKFYEQQRHVELSELDAKLRAFFRPEFLNRLDETVVFQKLSPESLQSIVELKLDELRQKLAVQKIYLSVSEDALKFCGEKAYSPEMGARPLLRFIQKNLETPLSRLLLSGAVHPGDSLSVNLDDEKITFLKNGIKLAA
jgi:ATP-dependent Clp protease ATP-binding subunit ClpB